MEETGERLLRLLVCEFIENRAWFKRRLQLRDSGVDAGRVHSLSLRERKFLYHC
jgi:hypothetical protein